MQRRRAAEQHKNHQTLTHHADWLVDQPRGRVGVVGVDARALQHLAQELQGLGVEALHRGGREGKWDRRGTDNQRSNRFRVSAHGGMPLITRRPRSQACGQQAHGCHRTARAGPSFLRRRRSCIPHQPPMVSPPGGCNSSQLLHHARLGHAAERRYHMPAAAPGAALHPRHLLAPSASPICQPHDRNSRIRAPQPPAA